MKQRKRTQKKRSVRIQMGGVQQGFLTDIAGLFYQLYKEHNNDEKGTQKILEYVRDIEKLYSKDEKGKSPERETKTKRRNPHSNHHSRITYVQRRTQGENTGRDYFGKTPTVVRTTTNT